MQAAWQPPTVTSPTLAPGAVPDDRRRHGARRALDLAVDAIDHLDVLVAVLGVARRSGCGPSRG